jgi:hypothetical protein
MGGMTSPSDPIELRVLDALARAGGLDEVAALVAQPTATVAPVLHWSVAQGLATRLDLPSGPSYTLTPRGLETVSMRQQIAQAVNVDGRVDFSAATQLVMDGYQAAREAAVEQALRDQADWLANDGVRDRVTSALNDAYARGALTQEELDTRTTAALSATTMGQLRAAAHGVLDLPPLLTQPTTGPTMPTGQFSWQPQVTVDPGVLKVAGAVRSLWRRRGGSDGDQPAADA